ncbi:MAG: sensor histidine kinase [Acidobacteriota bacterium]
MASSLAYSPSEADVAFVGIVALCVYIFGVYAYGSLLVLTLRQPHGRCPQASGGGRWGDQADRVGLAMFATCALWFVVNSLIQFRWLVGDTRNDDLLELAALEIVFLFPALIFHTVLAETASRPAAHSRGASAMLVGLYATGLVLALYITAAIFRLLPSPRDFNLFINVAVGTLFTATSAASIAVMARRSARSSATRDERRMRFIMMGLFAAMIAVFGVLMVAREQLALLEVLDAGVRATPLAFLLVSVYFENRIEFYDSIIKRGVLLLSSLLLLGGVLAVTLEWVDRLPGGAARPWAFAVVLLPVVMVLPWLHDRGGRLLDRLWFGREFTPVEAVKHVLAAMQQATDEATLVAAAQDTLSEMFRRRIVILLEDQAPPPGGVVAAEVPSLSAPQPIRLATLTESGARTLLSEDHALLRSLASVFSFMLENVRLHRKRQEQEQVAHELRLQTSQSELKALRAQINPHFLFNALNAIASLIHTDPARADTAVEQLAEVFRYTLRRSEQEWAPLDQELALARAYLDVEQARFGQRLVYSIDADATLARAQVPSMLLQTLVENAVKHGISRLRTTGRIEVRASRHDRRVTLEVRDTGPGPDQSPRRTGSSGESFGLRSVRERLQALFGQQAALVLEREEGATVARMEMPLVEAGVPATVVR